jgi:hypothetical protein
MVQLDQEAHAAGFALSASIIPFLKDLPVDSDSIVSKDPIALRATCLIVYGSCITFQCSFNVFSCGDNAYEEVLFFAKVDRLR